MKLQTSSATLVADFHHGFLRNLFLILSISFLISSCGGGGSGGVSGGGDSTLATPSGVVAVAGDGQIALSWNPVANATSYHLKRSTTAGGPYTQTAAPTSAAYTETGLSNGTPYYYVVTAANAVSESANSNEVSTTPVLPAPVVAAPAAPSSLHAVAANGTVSLSWTASTTAASYTLKRATSSGGPYTSIAQIAASASTAYTDSGLTNGTTYYYVVSALNAAGESGNSSEVSTTTSAVQSPPTVAQFLASGTTSPVTVSSFTATDDLGVTGYLITESATPPAASSPSWSTTAPTSYATLATGAATLYPWAKDASGNVSAVYASPVTLTLTALAATPKFGTNLNWMIDWDPEKLPADLMWSARPWATVDGNGTNVGNWAQIDSHGWPIVTAGTQFGAIFEMAPWVGTYKLSFKNRQGTTGDTVTSRNGNITLTNRQHNVGTNVTTYDVNVPSYSASQFIWLMWAGTTGGVTDVHLMRPLKDGSGWHAIGTPLSDHIIDRLAHFSTIRTMQTGGGSDLTTGTDTVWSGRTKPWSSQNRSSDAGRTGGVAIENLIAMANQANKDLWINIPFRANDDYIRKMAQVLRYGSDGITPYSSERASPVFAPLKPNLNLYVEHGNEIWNPGYGYWSGENYNLSQAEIAAGDPHHATYRASTSNTWGYSWRRVGWLAVRHSLIFREVFGDAAMMTRVRPILATQHARYATTEEPLYYLRDVWGKGNGTQVNYGSVNEFGNVAHPVNYYIYALSTALYFPDSNASLNVSSAATMLDGVISQLNSTAAEGLFVAAAWNYNFANSLGLKYVAYEGGANLIPQLMNGGGTPDDLANAKLANYDPVQGARMGANIDAGTGLPLANQSNYIYGRVFDEWAKLGGGLFMHYVLGSGAGNGGIFGLCPPSAQSGSDPRLETGPKWEAVKSFGKAWGQ